MTGVTNIDDARGETDDLSPDCAEFLKQLVAQIRAQDTYGHWAGKPNSDLLEPYILDAEKRKALPIVANPDPDTLWRLELFYAAIGMTIEKKTGVMAGPMMRMSPEGFGRMVLIAGKLVVVDKHLRDVHRFGFASTKKLCEQALRLISGAIELIEKNPEVARG